MAGTTKAMDGYIRVSQVAGRSGDRFQSPTAQRDAISNWAQTHGIHIAKWHEDLDQSGGTMDRPGMNDALQRVATGKTSGVIVARLDRFARTLIGGLTTIQQLHEKGARVVSVAEQVDPATPMGRAMLGLLLIMGEWQRDQADEHLAAAQHRATSAGRFPGRPAFGYARDKDGLTAIDPAAALIVERIFRERAAGRGWRAIADGLIRDGIPTSGGRAKWAPSTIYGIIRSETYLGVFTGPRGLRVENAWPAIITHDVWHAANSHHGVRDDTRAYQDRLLAGIARCAECRYVMTRTVNPHGFVSYGCRTVGCRGRPSIGTRLLDEHVTGLINERLARLTLEPRPAEGTEEADLVQAARDSAVRELEAWRDDVGLRTALGDRDWREGMLARARARDEAEATLAEFRARGGMGALDELPQGVALKLDMLPWKGRRDVVEALLHSVWLRKSRYRGPAARQHVADRLLVVWRSDPAPPKVPSRHGTEIAPLRW